MPGNFHAFIFTAFVFASAFSKAAEISENSWPQFLGPQRDGVYRGAAIAREWPKDGPRKLWEKRIGQGLAGVAVENGRVILFHRVGEKALVECFEARSGRSIWKAEHATNYRDDFGFDEGPRATPTIAGGRVFTFGAEGFLACWKFENGQPLWSIDTTKEFGSAKGFFGRACSPLVEDSTLVLNAGGPRGFGIVGLDAATGKLKWKATNDEASYSSPAAATINGKRVIFSLTREALVALSPQDGHIFFRYPWRPAMNASVTSATPLITGDLIFISASYDTGAALLRFHEGAPEVIWANDTSMSNHYATCVQRDGFLYGWHGRQEQGAELRCVELRTGKVRWSQDGLRAGSVMLAGDELLILTEQGTLIRAPASPEKFAPTASVQVLPSGVRAFPAMADGLFFARGKNQLICLDLASPSGK